MVYEIPVLVGVWSMCLWDQMGQPKHVNLVELGPGRRTLMADLLRGAACSVCLRFMIDCDIECAGRIAG